MTQEATGEMADGEKVKVDGEEAVLHITDQAVMFEKGGRVTGIERSAIRLVKPDGEAMLIAYSAGNEVKSVRVEPMTVVASLLVSGSAQARSASSTGVNEVFERLYKQTRKELEERLAKVQAEPENKGLRLSKEEEGKYSKISRQLENMLGAQYGFNPHAEDTPISFWGLEKQPYELQLGVVKALHISYLRMLVDPTAERNDVVYSGTEVWPDDWERILTRFELSDRPLLTEKYKRYLESHWKYHPGERKPALARP